MVEPNVYPLEYMEAINMEIMGVWLGMKYESEFLEINNIMG